MSGNKKQKFTKQKCSIKLHAVYKNQYHVAIEGSVEEWAGQIKRRTCLLKTALGVTDSAFLLIAVHATAHAGMSHVASASTVKVDIFKPPYPRPGDELLGWVTSRNCNDSSNAEYVAFRLSKFNTKVYFNKTGFSVRLFFDFSFYYIHLICCYILITKKQMIQ